MRYIWDDLIWVRCACVLICYEDFIKMRKHEFFFRGPQTTCDSSNAIICDYESELDVILWLFNMERESVSL